MYVVESTYISIYTLGFLSLSLPLWIISLYEIVKCYLYIPVPRLND